MLPSPSESPSCRSESYAGAPLNVSESIRAVFGRHVTVLIRGGLIHAEFAGPTC